MTISKAALVTALALGGAAAPAFGQAVFTRPGTTDSQVQAENQAQQPHPERQYTLSRAERAALAPALTAAQASDWPTAQTALAAAAAAARGPDAKYIVGQLQVQIGLGTQNVQLQSAGVDAMLASGSALPTQMLALYSNQARFAADAGDIAKADRANDQVIALAPNDPLAIPRAAQLWVDRNNVAHALEYFGRALAAQEAAGHPASAEVHRLHLAMAYHAHSPQSLALSRAYLALVPTPAGWHDALLIYRELSGTATDDHLALDIYRLMRAAGAMTSERDYVEYAALANSGAMFGEVKTVLDAGFARNVITAANTASSRAELNAANTRSASDRASLAAERTSALAGSSGGAALRVGDALYSYGEYGQAAELYRAALQKGGQDANLVNTRLGAALALGGQRAEAETAFRAVTGVRAELAQLWLFWLSRPQA
jgi:tetratricopeptide (TPR) repeat protein